MKLKPYTIDSTIIYLRNFCLTTHFTLYICHSIGVCMDEPISVKQGRLTSVLFDMCSVNIQQLTYVINNATSKHDQTVNDYV